MKKLLMLLMLGMMLSGSVGCRVVECWKYAWNSRFGKPVEQQTVVVADPCCVVSDECVTPCPAPCCAAPTITTTPMPVN